jgi:tetratricopeptide (TPR) repeat protein
MPDRAVQRAFSLLADSTRRGEGLQTLEVRAAEHPSDAQRLFELASAYDFIDREDDAARTYEQVRAVGLAMLAPEDEPRWHVQYGSTLRLLGRIDESRAILREGRERFPNDAAVATFAALTELFAGDAKPAISALFRALLATGDPTIAHYQRAIRNYAADLGLGL